MSNDAFCSLPFVQIFLGPDGHVKTCCSARDSLGSLHEHTIEDLLQNDRAKEVRQFILENKWHPQCYQCKNQEAQGARSERASNKDDIVSEFGSLDKTFFKLKRLDLRWSNTCNLSCVYCYEYFSSKWSEIKGIKVNTIKDENEESLLLFIEKSKNQSHKFDSINMLGGEPLLQKQNSRLIDILSGHGFYILTNLAVPLKTNPIAQKLLNEKHVHWGVSFETVGDRYEYVRRGASWKTFTENVNYYHSKISSPEYRLDAHSLYSVYSAFNLVEFYQYILDNNFQNVFWNLLESSGNNVDVNVLHMSKKLRLKAIGEIDRCVEKFPDAPGIAALLQIKSQLLQKSLFKISNDKKIVEDILDIESKLQNKFTFDDLWPELVKDLKC